MNLRRSRAFLFVFCILMMANHLAAQTLDWGASGSGTPSGGTGNWNTTSPLWATDGTSTYQNWPNTTAIAQFGGTGGTVTLTANISAGGLTFNSGGYVLNGSGTLSLIDNGSIINLTHAGQTTTINTTINPTDGNLTVVGPGILVLGGVSPTANNFLSMSGGSTIKLMGATGSLGTVGFGPTVNFGSNSDLTVQGSTFILDNTGATGTVTGTIVANVDSGENTIESVRVAGQNVALDLQAFPQAFGGTVNLVTVGGTNGTTNKIMVGSFETGLWSESIFFNGSSYAYNGGSFVRAVNYGVDSGSYTTSGTSTISSANGKNKNVQITGNVTAQATLAFNTLNVTGTASMTLASGQTVTTNGILKSGGGTSTISGGTALKGVSSGNDHIVVRTDLSSDILNINTTIANGSTTSIIKSGAGVLNLTGTNTYQGATLVDEGTLLVNNTTGTGIGNTTTGSVSVLQGATLGGHGKIGGATEIESGATLSPSAASNGAGTLTLKAGLQLDGGSALTLNLGTVQDKIAVTGGTFDFSGVGNLTLNLTGTTGYLSSQDYTLIDWTGTTSHNIVLSDFALGTTPAGSAGQLAIVGSTLVLQGTVAVPEPSMVLLLTIGFLGLVSVHLWRLVRRSA